MSKVTSQGSGVRGQGSGVRKILLFLLFSVPCTLYPVPCSHAVDIEPMRLEYSLEAGKTYSGAFQLKNTSDAAVDIYVSTGEYRYLFTKGSMPPEGARETLPSCGDWFQFTKTKLNLSPGGTAEAKFLIKIPDDAAQEHLCAVIFDEKKSLKNIKPGKETGKVQIQVIPRFSVPVYISMKKNENISAEIKEITAESEFKKDGLIFNVTIENTGNAHIRPLGTLVILDQNNEVVKNIPIGKSLPVFPGYKEQIPIFCPKIPPGEYSAVATVEIIKDKIIQKKTMFKFQAKK